MSKLNDVLYDIRVKYEDNMVADICVYSSVAALREVQLNLLSAKEIKIKKENY